ncbi:STAS domain-containing protein [Micromonospora endophytica]|uniref:Anti-sigma factor antagonist n=1 Tax=Micromonospora endophytica TaxID=515350 RepID=A0A2W2DPP6_9ACTN|nr:STAS domain-containing protein [Micromonospora endophytica]PZF99126.1 anti-sigma factor antagonist [Micromonospora endophytica]RIW48245.1 anti-sigma factor antagonist [Micromonospora endophytica]BCJ56699.1 hypothetical protein Jiend_01210 [Micromonospora endophytica]
MREREERFHVETTVSDEAVRVRVVGVIDVATVAAFRSALWSAPSRPQLRVDFSDLLMLSAAGVRTLVAARLRVRAQGGELVLVNPSPMVERVLRATGLRRVIPVVAAAPQRLLVAV